MIYIIMRDNMKFIASKNVSTLDPSDYHVNKTGIRLKYLDNTIKGVIGDL